MAKKKSAGNDNASPESPSGTDNPWKPYAPGVEVWSAESAAEDRTYRGWPNDLIDAGVIGEDLREGGYAIYGDKRVVAEVYGEGWMVVRERPVDFDRLLELSGIEGEMLCLFRRCTPRVQRHTIDLMRRFSCIGKSASNTNVVDFKKWKRGKGLVPA